MSSCVEDFEEGRGVVDGGSLSVTVLDGGVIFFNKVRGTELDGEGGLAHSSITKDTDFVDGFVVVHVSN